MDESEEKYLKVIVKNLIQGMSPSRIPPEYRKKVLPHLKLEKDIAIKLGRVDVVKRIQNVERSIKTMEEEAAKKNENEKKSNSSKSKKTNSSKTNESSPTTSKPKARRKSNQSPNKLDLNKQSQVQISIQQLLDNEYSDLTDPNIINQVIPILKANKNKAIKQGDYVNAQVLQNMIIEFRKKSNQSICWNEKAENYTALKTQLLHAENDLNDVIRFWEIEKEKSKQEMLAAEHDLAKLHEEQTKDFLALWPETLPPSYRKMSRRVLDMKETEKKMALAGRFEEAILARSQADTLEKQEISLQKQQYELDFDKSLLALQRAQEKEMRCLKQKWEIKLQLQEVEQEKEIETMKLIVHNLKMKIDPHYKTGILHEKPFFVGVPDSADLRATTMRASNLIYSKKKPSQQNGKLRRNRRI